MGARARASARKSPITAFRCFSKKRALSAASRCLSASGHSASRQGGHVPSVVAPCPRARGTWLPVARHEAPRVGSTSRAREAARWRSWRRRRRRANRGAELALCCSSCYPPQAPQRSDRRGRKEIEPTCSAPPRSRGVSHPADVHGTRTRIARTPRPSPNHFRAERASRAPAPAPSRANAFGGRDLAVMNVKFLASLRSRSRPPACPRGYSHGCHGVSTASSARTRSTPTASVGARTRPSRHCRSRP